MNALRTIFIDLLNVSDISRNDLTELKLTSHEVTMFLQYVFTNVLRYEKTNSSDRFLLEWVDAADRHGQGEIGWCDFLNLALFLKLWSQQPGGDATSHTPPPCNSRPPAPDEAVQTVAQSAQRDVPISVSATPLRGEDCGGACAVFPYCFGSDQAPYRGHLLCDRVATLRKAVLGGDLRSEVLRELAVAQDLLSIEQQQLSSTELGRQQRPEQSSSRPSQPQEI